MGRALEKKSVLGANADIEEEDVRVPEIKSAQTAPSGEGHRLKDMQNLDPKAIFANERTLLHYAEKGTYLGVVAVAMLHQTGPMQITGVILVMAAAAFYIWMLFEYISRLERITGRAAVAKAKTTLR